MFAADKNVYAENPQKTDKTHSELISNYSRLQDTRLICKSNNFPYTSNEQLEFEIKNMMPFTLAPRKRKYVSINLARYKPVQDFLW